MNRQRSFHHISYLHAEWIALLAALVAMALINPYTDLPTLCPIERLGITFCPGEGFGRSVALAVRGQFQASYEMHAMGMPGIGLIVHRIFSIFHRNNKIQTL